MLSLKILSFSIWLMTFSVGYLLAELLRKKFGNINDKNFLKVARIILLVVGAVLFIWLLLKKELFHWNYDISTGEPVDYYNTYRRCIINTIIALMSNLIVCVVYIKNKK